MKTKLAVGESHTKWRRTVHAALVVLVGLAGPSCGLFDRAPRAEVVMVVDTDLPVPRLVGNLRVDVFRITDAAGDWSGLRWVATNDFTLENRRDWPASFGITLDEGERRAKFLVRLRASRSGITRSYRGDRFLELPAADGDGTQLFVVPPPAADERPRLFVGAADRTPALEPRPSSAVDRMLVVDLMAEQRWKATVLLDGDCAGVEADLAGRRTCTRGTLASVPVLAPDADSALPERGVDTLEGRWPVATGPKISVDCDAPEVEAQRQKETVLAGGKRLFDDEVCLPGGAFLFGAPEWALSEVADARSSAGLDEQRIVAVPRVFLDRYEYSVGRAKRSSASAKLAANDGPLDGTTSDAACTFSRTAAGRDAYPLNCVSDAQARALCEADGRGLSSVVVYLYALHNGPEMPTTWPWGEVFPDNICESAVVERGNARAQLCGTGLLPLDDPNTRTGPYPDISHRGVRDLLGSLNEIQDDAASPFAARCWRGAGPVAPGCRIAKGPRWRVGASWRDAPRYLYEGPFLGTLANAAPAVDSGFRCMRFVDPR